MRKDVRQYLEQIAETLPIIFTLEWERQQFTGKWMRLTAWAETMDFDPAKTYWDDVPVFRAVEHIHQLKDAWKRGGTAAVKQYCETVRSMEGYIDQEIGKQLIAA